MTDQTQTQTSTTERDESVRFSPTVALHFSRDFVRVERKRERLANRERTANLESGITHGWFTVARHANDARFNRPTTDSKDLGTVTPIGFDDHNQNAPVLQSTQKRRVPHLVQLNESNYYAPHFRHALTARAHFFACEKEKSVFGSVRLGEPVRFSQLVGKLAKQRAKFNPQNETRVILETLRGGLNAQNGTLDAQNAHALVLDLIRLARAPTRAQSRTPKTKTTESRAKREARLKREAKRVRFGLGALNG